MVAVTQVPELCQVVAMMFTSNFVSASIIYNGDGIEPSLFYILTKWAGTLKTKWNIVPVSVA